MNTQRPEDRTSVIALRECIELQIKKAEDYQSDASEVTQAMYYRRGLDSINDIINAKILRIESLLDKHRAGYDAPNFESLEDSYKDLINYASFAISWIRGDMEGQNPTRGLFNVLPEPKTVNMKEYEVAEDFPSNRGTSR